MSAPALVVGYDGSSPSRAALRYAARRAARDGTPIVVTYVHALPPPDLAERAYEALLADHRRQAQEVIDQLRADPPPELDGTEWRCVLEGAGSPCEGLLQVAGREDAAAIVVATHGRGRVSALLGSVAHDLLRASDRPVVAIPPGAVTSIGETP